MTDLQTSLMAIGGAILVGVISYNEWQEYKAKKSMDRASIGARDDASFGADAGDYHERHEPSLVAPSMEPAPGAAMADDAPLVAEQPLHKITSQHKLQQTELPVDGVIDCLIPLVLEAPVPGEKLMQTLRSVHLASHWPIHCIGQRDDGLWESIAASSIYTRVSAGVQLANRRRALNEVEYSELVVHLRQLADQLDAELDVPDMMPVIATARELHQFILEYDAKLSVNVMSNGAPWAIDTLLAALTRQGFDARSDGQLVMSDGEGGTLFSLSTNAAPEAKTTSRLTLLLDVPCVASSRDGLGAMVACAKMLAARLGGSVVDDSNQRISDAALAEIAAQVATFYAHMQEASIPAGSVRAKRLFSA